MSDAAADEATLQEYAIALADAIDAALPRWVERCVTSRVTLDSAGVSLVREVAARAHVEVGTRVRALLLADVDTQRGNPLALLRDAVCYPTEVLDSLTAPVPDRDEFARRNFPHDRYDLTPASFADVDPTLQEPGLLWGAAKAHVFLQRRRTEGRR